MFEDVREVSLESPIEQLDRAAEAAVRRLKAFHPENSGGSPGGTNLGFPQRGHFRSRAGAYVRREETRHAMWAKREWSGLQGFTQEEQVMMDVSDLGSGRVAEDGIPLGEGWLLQISGVAMSGRRKSLGSKSERPAGDQMLRDWGPPVLLPTQDRWQEAFSSLPKTPLGWEEERSSSGRHSVGSLELFAGTDTDFSTATCPRMSPRPTFASTFDSDELEVFNVWTQSPSAPASQLVVAPQTTLPTRRPSFFRRSSASTSASEHTETQTSPVRHVKSHPGPRRSAADGMLSPRGSRDETCSSCSSNSRSTLLPPLDAKVEKVDGVASLAPDKSPLFQRRRRKAIMSDDSVTSIANLSTTDGSGCWN